LKKLAQAIKRVGIVGNPEKVSAHGIVLETARLVARAGREVHSDATTARWAGLKSKVHPDIASLARNVDLLLVFGGDGTMLRAASQSAGLPTPLLGINVGSLGFLTDVSLQGIPMALKSIWRGDFTLETRPLIEVSGRCSRKPVRRRALNDFVISRGVVSRLIALDVDVNGEPLTRYRCDGLIISSPTGSTAYSLSAGGAVVHPQAGVFAITPICPHTLSNRSVIVNLDSKIHVKVLSSKPEVILSADSDGVSEMAAGDVVTVSRSRDSVRLMHLYGRSFFDTLRRKLHWSGANV
jgi:NAD+ kinase